MSCHKSFLVRGMKNLIRATPSPRPFTIKMLWGDSSVSKAEGFHLVLTSMALGLEASQTALKLCTLEKNRRHCANHRD